MLWIEKVSDPHRASDPWLTFTVLPCFHYSLLAFRGDTQRSLPFRSHCTNTESLSELQGGAINVLIFFLLQFCYVENGILNQKPKKCSFSLN